VAVAGNVSISVAYMFEFKPSQHIRLVWTTYVFEESPNIAEYSFSILSVLRLETAKASSIDMHSHSYTGLQELIGDAYLVLIFCLGVRLAHQG
jgi:hypothetical protein